MKLLLTILSFTLKLVFGLVFGLVGFALALANNNTSKQDQDNSDTNGEWKFLPHSHGDDLIQQYRSKMDL